jgi:ferric-dicitrate binding protein FerR (iron transport regulator)
MNDGSFQRDRLEELLLASASEAFSVEERDELNALLLNNPAARAFAADFLALDALLTESLGASEAAFLYTVKNDARSEKKRPLPLRPKVWLATAAAAAVVVVGMWMQSRRRGSIEHVAVSEAVGFVQSAMQGTGFKTGDAFQPGDWVRFEQGRVAVRFESGAKLAVQGPADFRILSNNSAQMIRGRATIRVPGKIKGFTLDTPTEQIVDLGTAFGVKIEDTGATSIAVFEGSIELRGRRHDSRPQQLSAGESVRVEGNSNLPSEIPYEVSDYLQTWQTSFGMEAVEGAMRIAEPNERAVPARVVDSDRLLIFPERESVELPAGFVVSAAMPGDYHSPKGLRQQAAIEVPVVVDSFLIQFNPGQMLNQGSPRRFSGTLKFDRPVVGLLFRAAMLDESDAMLGLPSADFGGIFRRGINAGDEVSLNVDRRTLTVSLDVLDGVDQIRVLVASNPSNSDSN